MALGRKIWIFGGPGTQNINFSPPGTQNIDFGGQGVGCERVDTDGRGRYRLDPPKHQTPKNKGF